MSIPIAIPLTRPSVWTGLGLLSPEPETVQRDLLKPEGDVLLSDQALTIASPRGTGETDSLIRQEPIATNEKHTDVTFSILSSFYRVVNPSVVKAFLSSHQRLYNLLFEAIPKVKEAWGMDTKPEIELLLDPEDDSESVVVYVKSDQDDAFEALDRFDEHWWLSRAGSSDGLLTFTVQSE